MDSENGFGITEDELMEMLSWLKPLPEMTKEQIAMGYSSECSEKKERLIFYLG